MFLIIMTVNLFCRRYANVLICVWLVLFLFYFIYFWLRKKPAYCFLFHRVGSIKSCNFIFIIIFLLETLKELNNFS